MDGQNGVTVIVALAASRARTRFMRETFTTTWVPEASGTEAPHRLVFPACGTMPTPACASSATTFAVSSGTDALLISLMAAGVEHGMRATTGAIEEVWINGKTHEPDIRVIGGCRPRGLCGSGLISLLAEMFMTGVIDKAGHYSTHLNTPRIREGEHGPEYVVAWANETYCGQDIAITHVDVDNLLRAKAPIYAGFTVMTGGGPGVMEAANRGAHEAGGSSVGMNITLPEEQSLNEYVDIWMSFDYFFVRKVMLIKYSYAFVVLPGGFGTLDEVYDAATLIQTRKIGPFPVVIMGSEYWAPIMEFMRTTMVSAGTISPEDLSYFLVTDSPEEAVRHILAAVTYRFGLRWEPRRRTRRRVWPSRDPARPG